MSTLESDTTQPQFPLINAILLTPEPGEDGRLAICSNTTAPGQVLNELGQSARSEVAVLGSLTVNRDGAERMILNSLTHPTLQEVVLFGQETTSFSPSTNLLSAVMHGIDEEDGTNRIVGGIAASPQYPNLNTETLDLFRNNITLLPLFISKKPRSSEIIEEYLDWLGDRTTDEVKELLAKHAGKSKIYYDALNDLIDAVADGPAKEKQPAALNPQDYQHLQPPVIRVASREVVLPTTAFSVHTEGGIIHAAITVNGKTESVSGNDEFALAYTVMKTLGQDKELLSPVEQLTLGAALGQAGVEMRNDISVPPLAPTRDITTETTTHEQQHPRGLKMDEDYYYRVGITDDELSVTCMAHDTCKEVFELRSDDLTHMLDELANLNRFMDYEMDILHRIDVGIQLGRADIARKHGYEFMQDFPLIFQENTTKLPFKIVESDTFLDAHRRLLLGTYTEGLSHQHPDAQKGTARTLGALVVLRDAAVALDTMPQVYRQGSEPTEVTRATYAKQLLRLDHDGDYSYGERTRSFWGYDQLEDVVSRLADEPTKAVVIQRFDPSIDMGMNVDVETGRTEYTHDPCLTHDVFWQQDGKLHSLHVARAHNFVNAYPENIYGLFDSYVSRVREELGVAGGDMFVLSTRGNILLLTEEPKAKSLMIEPTKPYEQTNPGISGPHVLGTQRSEGEQGLFVHEQPIMASDTPIDSQLIARLRNYKGVDTIERAIQYLETKGASHNNPVLSEYAPGTGSASASQMPFFQANVYGGKLYATAVFTNRTAAQEQTDAATVNYLAGLFANRLGAEPGTATIIKVRHA